MSPCSKKFWNIAKFAKMTHNNNFVLQTRKNLPFAKPNFSIYLCSENCHPAAAAQGDQSYKTSLLAENYCKIFLHRRRLVRFIRDVREKVLIYIFSVYTRSDKTSLNKPVFRSQWCTLRRFYYEKFHNWPSYSENR